jgi:surfactin synthase thioesterase subunit
MVLAEENDPASRWFVHLPPRRAAPVRLVAFPHAGAGCGAFGRLARLLGGRLEVFAANLPGRQARYHEPARTRFAPLIDELADDMPRLLDDGRPYALFGYCSGALLAYGLLHQLRRRGLRLPDRLVAVSYLPPHQVPRYMSSNVDYLGLPAEEFWQRVIALGGVPDMLAAVEHRTAFETGLRADHAVIADYVHQDDEVVADGAITVITGREDPVIGPDTAADWARYTGDDFRLKVLDGGHWLLDESPEELADVLVRELGG